MPIAIESESIKLSNLSITRKTNLKSNLITTINDPKWRDNNFFPFKSLFTNFSPSSSFQRSAKHFRSNDHKKLPLVEKWKDKTDRNFTTLGGKTKHLVYRLFLYPRDSMEITVQPASSSMAPRALPSLPEMKAHQGDRINGSECCAGMRHTGDQLRSSCDCAAGTILHRPLPTFCARLATPPPQPLYNTPFTLFLLFHCFSTLLSSLVITPYRFFAFTAIFIDVFLFLSFF